MSAEQQTVYRVGHRTLPFSQLANDMIRDKRATTDARFLLVFVLTYPPDWEFNISWLQRELGWGRDKTRNAIKSLVKQGYCKRDRNRNDDGTLKAFDYFFTDIPTPAPENPSVVAPTSDWKPVTGNQSLVSNKDTNKHHKDPPFGGRSSRRDFDESGRKRPARVERFVSEDALNRVRSIAPKWDRQMLLRKFLDWPGSAKATNMDGAFIGWVKKFTAGKKPA